MNELDRVIRECDNICNRYEKYLEDFDNGRFANKFKLELINMAYLIAYSDGMLDKPELSTINKTFDLLFNEAMLKKHYGDDFISEDSFLARIPSTIINIAQVEKKQNMDVKCFLNDTRKIYGTFKQYGLIVIHCNGRRNEMAHKLLKRFLEKILCYIMTLEEKDELAIEKTPKIAVKKNDPFQVSNLSNLEQMNAVIEEVDSLIGLADVKKEIHDLVNLLMVRKLRADRGIKTPSISMHLVFTGNPGTGKTTIARKMAEIFKCLGVLDKGHLIETDRAGMVSGYMGQTATKVTELSDSAMGGILFIDEAYTLSNGKRDGDFGQEAIDTLLKIMEDRRENLIVIVAGYTNEMEDFLDSNPGLRSRFNKYIHFPDYSTKELETIFFKLCKEHEYTYNDKLIDLVHNKIEQMRNENEENFANAREIRNYFEKVISKQANRIMAMGTGSGDDLVTINEVDL